jgi:molybdate transport system regulatory protein
MTKSARNNALVRPRIQLGDKVALGPGKIDLLRTIGETRSISGAARQLGIGYKRAWMLIDTLNQGFSRPVVETATGGKGGGGARLTSLGEQIVLGYDALERRINGSAQDELTTLRKLLR